MRKLTSRTRAARKWQADMNALLLRLKNDLAKAAQDYDADPPRCGNCIYYTRGGIHPCYD